MQQKSVLFPLSLPQNYCYDDRIRLTEPCLNFFCGKKGNTMHTVVRICKQTNFLKICRNIEDKLVDNDEEEILQLIEDPFHGSRQQKLP